MSKNFNSLILISFLFFTCPWTNYFVRAQTVETLTNQTSTRILLKEELYFGLSKPGGKTVSEAEWQLFLNQVLTPRFKEGLTVLDAYGQYLNSAGILNREKTKLVILIYEDTITTNQLIEEAIATYKQMFG